MKTRIITIIACAFLCLAISGHAFAGSVNLISQLPYNSGLRDQGQCGNCWVWAGTGVMEMAAGTQSTGLNRASVQFFDSCEYTRSNFACDGGDQSTFASWYQSEGYAVPWSNTNAFYQDGNGPESPAVSCSSIGTTPDFPFQSIQVTPITTWGVGQSTAVANIKSVLNSGKPVEMDFCLPTSDSWNGTDGFYDFWNNGSQSSIWDPDSFCGQAYDSNNGGCHAVVIVGYNDNDSNTANDYWIVMNSWGTTENRPQGLYYMAMYVNYNCYYSGPDGGSALDFNAENYVFNNSPAPSISNLSPTSGSVGTQVTISGTNFGSSQGTSTVSFNGASATATTWSATSIVCQVPSGATTGLVKVTTAVGSSNGVTFTVTQSTPSISNLSPTSGSVGTQVTISGSNFGSSQGTSTVSFNGTSATASSWSATSIVCTVPSGATTGPVKVTTAVGSSNGVTFTVTQSTPSISNLSPASGSVGTQVTISGTNFGSSQGTSTVSFNGTSATASSWSATGIVCTVPSGATTGPVKVTTAAGPSNGVTFTVTQPTATHFSFATPAAATVGTPMNFTVTAQDSNNNTVTGYSGTVHLSSSTDSTAAFVPSSSTLSGGIGAFSVTFDNVGSQTITATDGTITTTSGPISVSASTTATHFAVSAPSHAIDGSAFGFTVTALDAKNHVVTGYPDRVNFTSTDVAASLPAGSTLTNGKGTFSATLNTPGHQTITATDAALGSITGTSGSINVAALSISGTVTNAKRKAMPGVTVSLIAGAQTVAQTTTLPNGTYKFSNLASGTYIVKPPDGFSPSTKQVTLGTANVSGVNFMQ